MSSSAGSDAKQFHSADLAQGKIWDPLRCLLAPDLLGVEVDAEESVPDGCIHK